MAILPRSCLQRNVCLVFTSVIYPGMLPRAGASGEDLTDRNR